jgi:hypothetical protein
MKWLLLWLIRAYQATISRPSAFLPVSTDMLGNTPTTLTAWAFRAGRQ